MKSFFIVFAVVALLSLTGCSNKVALTGKVTYSDDGGPLDVGTVCFATDTYVARGTLRPDGTYRVGSISERDGLPPGTYQVYIDGARRVIGTDRLGLPIYEPLIDRNFFSGTTSGITLTVPAPQGRFDFQVERYVPPDVRSGRR